jgi:hypothetical protein
MTKYHKIHSIWKRENEGPNCGRIIEGEYSLQEFRYLADCEWTATEKVDGTNIRVMWDGDRITFGGKTDNAQIPAPLVEALRVQFDGREDEFRAKFPRDDDASPGPHVVIYGEGYGPKIQSGGKYRSDPAYVCFDIVVGRWWLLRTAVEEVTAQMGIDVVPIVAIGPLDAMCDIVHSGLKSEWGDFEAEGVVAVPTVPLFARNGDRIITKIKGKDYYPPRSG